MVFDDTNCTTAERRGTLTAHLLLIFSTRRRSSLSMLPGGLKSVYQYQTSTRPLVLLGAGCEVKTSVHLLEAKALCFVFHYFIFPSPAVETAVKHLDTDLVCISLRSLDESSHLQYQAKDSMVPPSVEEPFRCVATLLRSALSVHSSYLLCFWFFNFFVFLLSFSWSVVTEFVGSFFFCYFSLV